MRAADAMTSTVVSIDPNSSVKEAAQLMLEKGISAVPVVDKKGHLVGIVSEGDLLRRAESGTERHRSRWLEMFMANSTLAAEYAKAHARKVKDVMTADVVTVAEETPLSEVADLLESRGIKRVPVVRSGQVVGVVARSDLLKAVATAQDEFASPAERSDRAIREKLAAEFRSQKWAPLAGSNVVVKKGVVHFWGYGLSEDERRAMRIAAENIPGVKAVRDHTTPIPLFPAI